MSVTNQQYNLFTPREINSFYNFNRDFINKELNSIRINTYSKRYNQNYVGTRHPKTNKLFEVNAILLYAINGQLIYKVCNKYSSKIQRLRRWIPGLEAAIAGIIHIESRFDHRANLKKSTQFKGLCQIATSNQADSLFSDLSGRQFDPSPINTRTFIGREPSNSIYNAEKSIEITLNFMNKTLDELIRLANKYKLKPNDRKYPVAPWAFYILWQQGRTGGLQIIEAYMKSSTILIGELPPGRPEAVINNPLELKNLTKNTPLETWVEQLRLIINFGFYLQCNACIARLYKSQLASIYMQDVVDGSQIYSDCTPLRESEYPVPLGNFVTRK